MMNIAGIQPQIWISIVAIVAAAAVALTVDFLRRRNEELQMAVAKLSAVREQPQTSAGSNPPVVEAPQASPVDQRPKALTEQERGAALSEWLAMRAAPKCAPAPECEAAPEPASQQDEAAEPEIPAEMAAPEAPETEPIPEVSPVPAAPEPEPLPQAQAAPEVFVDEALLEAILGGSASAAKGSFAEEVKNAEPARLRFEVIEGAGGIPKGMHDSEAFRRLIAANKPFSGLVFALGASRTDGRAAGQDVIAAVYQFVRGLLRDGDFGCQTGSDEFLLLSPGINAAEARRRVSDIAERLWDYQLRGVGAFSLLFSWGDVLVSGEPLSEAVESACERMRETRRARKTVSLEVASPRKLAVM